MLSSFPTRFTTQILRASTPGTCGQCRWPSKHLTSGWSQEDVEGRQQGPGRCSQNVIRTALSSLGAEGNSSRERKVGTIFPQSEPLLVLLGSCSGLPALCWQRVSLLDKLVGGSPVFPSRADLSQLLRPGSCSSLGLANTTHGVVSKEKQCHHP